MKQASDTYTRDFLEAPKRGRPRKANALTAAERARRYRANQRGAREASGSAALLAFLAGSGIRTRDDLADMTMDEAKALIVKARSYWFEGRE